MVGKIVAFLSTFCQPLNYLTLFSDFANMGLRKKNYEDPTKISNKKRRNRYPLIFLPVGKKDTENQPREPRFFITKRRGDKKIGCRRASPEKEVPDGSQSG